LDMFIAQATSDLNHLKMSGSRCLNKYHDRTLKFCKRIFFRIVRNYWRTAVHVIAEEQYIVGTYRSGFLRKLIYETTSKSYRKLKCLIPTNCNAGTYLHFEEWHEGTLWDSKRGWRCANCPAGTFKSKPGHRQCTLCPLKTVVNKERTFCYDPYKIVFLNTGMLTVQLCVGLSCFVSILVASFLFVLIKYHRTPVARAMDLKVSIFHLTLLLLHVLTNMFSFFGIPNLVRCIAQPACLSLLGTTSTSIVLVKSQKLLQVFNSRVKLEHRDIVLVIMKQGFIVLLNVIVSVSILVLSLQIYWFHIELIDDDIILERSITCDMSIHNSLQVGYQMLLQLACFIPAFRSRGLPSIFNDAIIIVYLSFTLLVVDTVMFPIQYFQKSTIDKTVVQWAFLNLNILLVSLIYYGKKMFIIVFRKEKNKKQYYQRKRLNSIQQNHVQKCD